MANRFENPFDQMFSTAVNFLSGGQLFFYATGTSTPATTYADSTLVTPNTNPVVLDSLGRHGPIFLDPSVTYKVVLEDSLGVVIGTADPIVDPAANVTAAFTVHAGNPNGAVAGSAGTVGGSGASVVWDITNHLLYVCTTTGNAAAAVWTQVGATLAGAVSFTGVLTPAALGADQNDYNPTGLGSNTIVRLTASTPVSITGLAGGALGRLLRLQNIGATNNITLTANDVASLAANRFAIPASIILYPSSCLDLIYDATSNLWRPTNPLQSSLKNIQVFTGGSGTYTPTPGARRAIVFVTGGGAGGGGAGTANGAFGAGGGAGATAVAFIAALTALAYTVGAAGAGGANTGAAGAAGGQSSLGTITANGGNGGAGQTSAANQNSVGGTGSSTTANATFSIPGGNGAASEANYGSGLGIQTGGQGGSSFWGSGGVIADFSTNAAVAGAAPGSGGSGAFRSSASTVGGAGAAGMILVLEF